MLSILKCGVFYGENFLNVADKYLFFLENALDSHKNSKYLILYRFFEVIGDLFTANRGRLLQNIINTYMKEFILSLPTNCAVVQNHN